MGAQGAGHQSEIFLAGEAVYLMKDTVTDLKGKNARSRQRERFHGTRRQHGTLLRA